MNSNFNRLNEIQVSIVVPTHNRKDLLIGCVKSLLNQNYPKGKYEVIVVDDGSTDRTEDAVKELIGQSTFNLKYLMQKNSGPAAARNMGIKNSIGEVIGLIDDDVTAPKDWIETAVKILSQNKDIIGGFGLYPVNLKPNLITRYSDFRDNYVRDNNDAPYLRTWNLFVKRKVFEKVGSFDETFKTSGGEDSEWCMRARRLGYILQVFPELKVSHNHPDALIKRFKVIYKYSAQQMLIHSKIKDRFNDNNIYYFRRFSIRICALTGMIVFIAISWYYNLTETVQGKILLFTFLLLFSMIFLLERRYKDLLYITSLNISAYHKLLFSFIFIVENLLSILVTIANITKGRTKNDDFDYSTRL